MPKNLLMPSPVVAVANVYPAVLEAAEEVTLVYADDRVAVHLEGVRVPEGVGGAADLVLAIDVAL